jgi:peptidoglycan/LPS O-acetylase OafA/YrhL
VRTASVPLLGYQPALDGLRGVSILAVLVAHQPFFTHGAAGNLGVDAFFVLSGFLISTLLIERYDSGDASLRAFYLRRAWRLFPALYTFLLLTVAVIALVAPDRRDSIFKAALGVAAYVSNYLFLARPELATELSPCWSLSVEEQFYLVWPIVLGWSLRRVADRANLARMLAAAVAGFVLWDLGLMFLGASEGRLLACLDTRADELLVGCLAAVARRWGLLPAWLTRPSVGVGFSALAGAAVLGIWGWPHHRFMLVVGRFALSLLIAVLILSVVATRRGVARLLAWRPLVDLGRISYSLYLWHVPVNEAIRASTGLQAWDLVLAQGASGVVVAAVSYLAIERPALNWSRRAPPSIALG